MEGMLFAAARSANLQALHDAVRGDVEVLLKLHSRGPVDTPLHLASMIGQTDFVREYMTLSSISAHQLSQLNEDGYSPLHLASANGHLQIVTFLLEFGRQKSAVEELCMKIDIDGRTALHSAVVSGKIDVIDVLFVHCPQAANMVTLLQETILHLAVKHHQQEGLQFLIDQKLGSSVASLLNLGDREGNTILHLATANKQLQTVEYLVKQPNLNVNTENSYGLRALDITFACALNSKDVYIEEAIRLAGGSRSQTTTTTSQTRSYIPNTSKGLTSLTNKWLKELRGGIIVMASVFATMSFQVALTPPGGVWQDWGSNTTMSNSSIVPAHQPGIPIFYSLDHKQFNEVMRINRITFVSSICTIILTIQPLNIQLRPPWNVLYILLGPYLVMLNVAVEFFSIESIMTKKSIKNLQVLRTYYPWLLVVVLALATFVVSNFLYFLPRRQRLRGSQNRQSSSNSSLGNSGP